jgi:hypothetical protein
LRPGDFLLAFGRLAGGDGRGVEFVEEESGEGGGGDVETGMSRIQFTFGFRVSSIVTLRLLFRLTRMG